MSLEDDEEEDFITYGEPLDDEEDNPRENPGALENQVVKDAQGRRRFHGAFTGGFSAGYFNSVGSKEGWTPSTFVSSRQNRSEKRNQTAEDFMDDEDLGEYGIAPRQVKTTANFTSAPSSAKRPVTDETSAIPGNAPLEDLVVVINNSVGAQILKKMGWREGQGVGPKEKKYKKKGKGKGGKDQEKMELEAENQSEHDQFEEQMKEFLFGPNDVEEFHFQMKSDLKGLGYRGISQDTAVLGGHINLFGSPRPLKGRGKSKGIKGSAFGIGAFEEPDNDIYATEDMNMYDRVLGGEDNSDDNFGWTAPKMKDGVGSCLEGFTPASGKRKCITKVFPPPALPSGFRPEHVFSDNLAPKKEEKVSRFMLSSAQRSALLGEEVLPGKSPSSESTSLALVPRDDKDSAPSSSSGDVSLKVSKVKKRSRFSDLSSHEDSVTTVSRESSTEGITEWERQRGRMESSQGAALYKPISSMMASRFVSAKYGDEEQVEYSAEIEVNKSHHENAAEMKMYGKLTRETFQWHPDHILCKRFNVPDPYPGSTTVGIPGMKRDKLSVFSFLSIPAIMAENTSTPEKISTPQEQEKKETTDENLLSKNRLNKKTRWDIKPAILSIIEDRRKNPSQEISEREKEGASEEQDEDSRPPMDLFNAIFNETDSSDSDSSDEKEEDEADKRMMSQTNEKSTPAPSVADQSKDSNSKNADPSVADQSKDSNSNIADPVIVDTVTHGQLQETVQTHTTSDRGSSEDNEQYGPALPPSSGGHLPVYTPPSGRQSSYSSSLVKPSSKHSSSHRKHKKHHRTSDSRRHQQKHRSHHRKKEKRKKERKRKKGDHEDKTKDRGKYKRQTKPRSESSYSSASEG